MPESTCAPGQPACPAGEDSPAGEPRAASHTTLYLLLLGMLFFWSLNFVVGKVALRQFPPLLLSGLRTLLAALLMAPLYHWSVRRGGAGDRVGWRDFLRLAPLAVFGLAFNQVLFIMGLKHTSVAHAAIVIAIGPIFVLFMAAFTGQEALTSRKLMGMLVALSGVATLNLLPANASPASLYGDLMILGAAFAFAFFTVSGKRVVRQYGSIAVNTVAYGGSAVVLLPVTLWQAQGVAWGAISWEGWLGVAYMALFPSVICYLIYYHALKFIPASKVSAFAYLQPVMATGLGVLLLGEPVAWRLALGGALVFAGVILAERS